MGGVGRLLISCFGVHGGSLCRQMSSLTLWSVKVLEENSDHLMIVTEAYFCKRPAFLQLVHLLYQASCVNGRTGWLSTIISVF